MRYGRLPFAGIRPTADPKGPPFVLFWDIHFWLTDKNVSKGASPPSAPTYTKFKGGARRKNAIFWLKLSKKVPYNAYYQILPVAQIFWPKKGLFSALEELGKSSPPRENLTSAPAVSTVFTWNMNYWNPGINSAINCKLCCGYSPGLPKKASMHLQW